MVAAQEQAGLCGLLGGVQTEFLEVGADPFAEPVGGRVVQRRAAPQSEGVVQKPVASGQVGCRGCLGDQGTELVHVHGGGRPRCVAAVATRCSVPVVT